MNIQEEINNMKAVINNLLIQQSFLMVKEQAATSLLFEIISESFPDKEKLVYTNFVNRIESETESLLNDVEEGLFDVDPGFLFRQKTQMKMIFLQMKESPLYLDDVHTDGSSD